MLAAQIAEETLLAAEKGIKGSRLGWQMAKKGLYSSDNLLAMNYSVRFCCEAELNTKRYHTAMSK